MVARRGRERDLDQQRGLLARQSAGVVKRKATLPSQAERRARRAGEARNLLRPQHKTSLIFLSFEERW